ncbi:hypothetical protein BS78_08G156100 [Paspalum vaginatum]|nr:hypothetical protein BS78_08G156100 [Paspalum vaginatum]
MAAASKHGGEEARLPGDEAIGCAPRRRRCGHEAQGELVEERVDAGGQVQAAAPLRRSEGQRLATVSSGKKSALRAAAPSGSVIGGPARISSRVDFPAPLGQTTASRAARRGACGR